MQAFLGRLDPPFFLYIQDIREGRSLTDVGMGANRLEAAHPAPKAVRALAEATYWLGRRL